MLEKIDQAASALARARKTVALTGAGISVESGIPPFRGKGGLWEKYDPMKYAHISAFEQRPDEVWKVLFSDLKTVMKKAGPNDGHHGLFRLEKMGKLQTVITQNIDGLHQKAGSSDVIEFHGTFATQSCTICQRGFITEQIDLAEIPPRCDCGGILRPNVVLFGETIGYDQLKRSQILASTCDVMLVVGTSATVEPAASLPVIAKRAGSYIIEINPEKTPLSYHFSDAILLGKAGSIMRKLVSALEDIL
ncbi:MAG: NAD-dependent deacylase [Desulfobacteraceae bacterium]|nr:NAD-dependent deacylase [Desulfobacteraceae bacterium]